MVQVTPRELADLSRVAARLASAGWGDVVYLTLPAPTPRSGTIWPAPMRTPSPSAATARATTRRLRVRGIWHELRAAVKRKYSEAV